MLINMIKSPRTSQMIRNSGQRLFSTTLKTLNHESSIAEPKHKPLSKAQLAFLERLLRVDQAGELGANYIYNGQYIALSQRKPELEPILRHMWDQEIHHHNTFNKLQTERRVRPSLLTPIWKMGAITLGITTGLLGKELAMACTELVETVIGGHYNEQLRVLMNQMHVENKNGELIISDEIKELQKLVSQFRDEELEHLETAVEHDAHGARPYWLLTEAIKAACKGAIWTAERV